MLHMLYDLWELNVVPAKSWFSNLFMAKGHTGYFGPVCGTRVKKMRGEPIRLNFCVILRLL
jgi:hypothetical protein